MIMSLYHALQQERDDDYGHTMPVVHAIVDQAKDIQYGTLSPAAKYIGSKILGRLFPAIGAALIVQDVKNLIEYVDERYPTLGRQMYEDVMDARRFYSGDRDLDKYYSDKWVKDSHW